MWPAIRLQHNASTRANYGRPQGTYLNTYICNINKNRLRIIDDIGP